jgi:hypothetical protein
MENNNLISVADYAYLCKTTPQAIYQRIYRGSIIPETKQWRGHPIALIDKEKYKPVIHKRGRKPYKSELA